MGNVGHNLEIPTSPELQAILLQLWQEQFRVVNQLVRLYGVNGLRNFSLDRWKPALVERSKPILERLALSGREAYQARYARPKRFKHGAAITLFGMPIAPGQGQRLPVFGQYEDYVEVFDDNVAEFARQWAYDFADSTLATSQYRILEAYQRTAEQLARGLERGATLDQLTRRIEQIFHDPDRAQMIAASEASRAYHGGQVLTAEESGEVSGKTWLASSDACEACLALNGKTVPLDQPFVEKPGRYGRVMTPPLHPRCMCSLTYDLSPAPRPTSFGALQAQPGMQWIQTQQRIAA